MPLPYSSFEFSKKVYNCLVDWEIDRKVFSITLDNTSANDVMVRLVKQQLLLQNSLLCEGEFFHVRCCAHILNLIVQDGLKIASLALGKIRESVKYVKGYEARMISFQECAQRVGINIACGLSTDVPTRWNSTYVMLDSAIKYRRVFCSLELQDRNYKCCPSYEEWSRGEKMCAFLYPFYAITNLISGSSYPTSNFYFLQVWKIECLLVENLESGDRVISDMATNMKLKFDKYWDDYSVILAMGAILDPRLKLHTSINKQIRYTFKIEEIKKKLYMLYDEYKKTSGGSSSSRVSTSQSQVFSGTSSVGVGGGGLGSMGGPGKFDENLISDYVDYRHRSQGGISSGDTKSYLDKYLDDDQLNHLDDIDVLTYWKEKEHRYGELAKMACDVLSIPITSVASESAFSIGAHVLNKYRNRLLPKKVQALICTRLGCIVGGWQFSILSRSRTSEYGVSLYCVRRCRGHRRPLLPPSWSAHATMSCPPPSEARRRSAEASRVNRVGCVGLLKILKEELWWSEGYWSLEVACIVWDCELNGY
nr:zinc finger BED domain-containing protein RICESLEEPER 2-like [Ipomoea batatas]